MPSSPLDFELGASLAAALAEDHAIRADRLSEVLSEHEQLQAHLALTVPAELRRYLEARRSSLAAELLELMAQWWAAGGGIELVLPSMAETDVVGLADDDETEERDSNDDETEERDAADEPSGLPAAGAEAVPTAGPPPSPEPRPPAPPPPAPPPPAPPATTAQLDALSQHLASGKAHIDEVQQRPWQTELEVLLARLRAQDDLSEEAAQCVDAARASADWARFPRDVQRALVGLTVARMRSLQDDHGYTGARLNGAFSALTAFSAREQPGFVFGLSRSHQPRSDSWADDADDWWDKLFACLPPQPDVPSPTRDKLLADLQRVVPELAVAPQAARGAVIAHALREIRQALDGGVRSDDPLLVRLATPLHDDLDGREFKALRRAIRDAQQPAEDDDDSASGAIPDDWPWRSKTAGRRAVLVGGDPREPNRQRIQQSFGFSELTWEDTPNKPRALEALRGRITRNSVDLVLMLGAFMGHSYDNVLLPACRGAGVDWAHVDHGYGVTRIRLAIERFVACPPPSDGSGSG